MGRGRGRTQTVPIPKTEAAGARPQRAHDTHTRSRALLPRFKAKGGLEKGRREGRGDGMARGPE